jgi:hypothetical protein
LNYIARFISQLTVTCEQIFDYSGRRILECGMKIAKKLLINQAVFAKTTIIGTTRARKTSHLVFNCDRIGHGLCAWTTGRVGKKRASHLLFK